MTEDMLTSDPCSKLPMPKDVAPPQPSMSEASYDALVASC
jgi:hypothetical protein